MAEEFRTPQSANEALLQNILGADNVLLEPVSRNEKILHAILGEEIELDDPQSVIEDLLLQINEQGIGGVDRKFIEVMNKTVVTLSPEDLAGVTSIKDYAFYNCESLVAVNLPDTLRNIGTSAFYRCRNLDEAGISLPASVEYVGNEAFAYTGIKSFVLPSRITAIPQGLFSNCQYLKNVEIQGEISHISGGRGFGAFRYCVNLETITLRSVSVPTLQTYVFERCDSLTSIYVPSESVEAYKQAANWSDYADIIKPIGE